MITTANIYHLHPPEGIYIGRGSKQWAHSPLANPFKKEFNNLLPQTMLSCSVGVNRNRATATSL
jgi:hypothetical protein